MYYVTMKAQKEDLTNIWETYWRGFLSSFRQATVLWVSSIAVLGILIVDFIILPVILPQWYPLLRYVVVAIIMVVLAFMLYFFPLTARFSGSIKKLGKTALLMIIAYYPYTLLLMLIHIIPVVCCLLSKKAFLNTACAFFVCGFAFVNRIASYFLNKVFAYYEA